LLILLMYLFFKLVTWIAKRFRADIEQELLRRAQQEADAQAAAKHEEGIDSDTEKPSLPVWIEPSDEPVREERLRKSHRDLRLAAREKDERPLRHRQLAPLTLFPDIKSRDRLFSDTMRTWDRKSRGLATDEAQLERYGLPVWKTEDDVAEALGISVKELRFFATHRKADKVCHYVSFAVRKRSGGTRLIMAPKRRLKRIQRQLLSLLVNKLPTSDEANGFLRGRSIRTAAEPHVGRRVLLKLDLESFFPTVHVGRVRGLLIALGYGYPVATTLAVLMTEAERQPVAHGTDVVFVPVGSRVCVQGAPTSPGLCNAVLRRMDRRLAGLARRHGYSYTRYADDLTFSGDDVEALTGLQHNVEKIIKDEGFRVNTEKTRVLRKGARQHLLGITVNETLGRSRRERRKVRAMLHRLKTTPPEMRDAIEIRQLAGTIAFLKMLNPGQTGALEAGLEELLRPSEA
jgi:hypothetical protein